ncbi:MAG: hypothetical protein C0469_13285 [Cyanobacteria bacterium DS2.3.42]|nr:hypothetical protein [Cyanobacteria bacterium DS2.3.42]
MNRTGVNSKAKVVTAALLSLFAIPTMQFSSNAAEMTIPGQTSDSVSPDIMAKFTYAEDTDLTKACGLPTYEWMPAGKEPEAVILGIHGLTLHGRRYRVLARTMALSGIGFVACDMRGFGRCHYDDENKFSTAGDDRHKVAHHKSYDELVLLTQAVRAKYPGKPVILLGESLGCTFCVKIAGEHNDLVDGLVLSAPAIKVNPKMYISPSDIKAGLASLVNKGHKVKLHGFLTKLVSPRKEVVDELLQDPLMVTELSLKDLIATDEFVEKTAKLGKLLGPHVPLLIIQGSIDGCVAPVHVTDFMMNVPSDDQTLCWRGKQGHLQLETSFVRATSIDALGDWIEDHSPSGKDRVAILKKSVEDVGGRLVQ